VTRPKSLRMKMHEMNRPPEYLQAYPAEEMDAYLAEVARVLEDLVDDAQSYATDYAEKWGEYRKDSQLVIQERVDRARMVLEQMKVGS
jgi:hypothetical protein